MAIDNFTDISTTGFDEDALTIVRPRELLRNFGDLTTTGDLANGIFADRNNVSILNFGTIETSGSGAAAISVEGRNAHIENHGSLITHGLGFFGDVELFAEGIIVFGDQFFIANHGTIRVEGESASAMVGIGDDGLITNFGVVESSAQAGSAVVVAVGARSQVINEGQITATTSDTSALSVRGEGASALNRGEIVITEPAGATGIDGNANTRLTNEGEIRITGLNSDGFGMVGFGSGGTQLNNSGLIETHVTESPFPNQTFGDGVFGMAAFGRAGELGENFEIVNTGHISTEGDFGIGVALGISSFGFRNAESGQVENSGVIETVGDGAAGVVMIGDGHHLTNNGQITSDGGTFTAFFAEMRAAGVVVSGDAALVENTSTGVIQSKNAGSAAVELNVLERPGLPAADLSSTVENSGLIRGADIAILGGAGQETVINGGRIVGDVVLGDGNDTFVFREGGVVNGTVSLGGGDDLVLIENGSGRTSIADFAAGASSGDVIDVSAFFSNFSQLTDHSRQRGSDVVVTLDRNDTLVLENVQLSTLNAGDFDLLV